LEIEDSFSGPSSFPIVEAVGAIDGDAIRTSFDDVDVGVILPKLSCGPSSSHIPAFDLQSFALKN
jgi:hypothetical protein